MRAARHPDLWDLRTPRLQLQRITVRDLPDLERMQADAQTMATLGGMRDAATTRRMVDDGIAHWDAYAFLPAFWGRGLATELASASVRAGFAELGLADLVCFTLTKNRASQRVMEKVGFVFERGVEHAGLPHLLYRLRASAWRSGAKS
ncbi:MAG: acetyltransferase, ribosomal protein N-acetylase [Deltaproteobacteria bacterium]|nr:acetyltransferase, ribosomal protein N-acetylase [Deltaproteobacteria bacterium]